MEVIGAIFLVVFLAVAFRLMAGSMDTGRIEAYVRERGWELVDRSWDPFGPGWFGEKDSRIYAIVYRDHRGDLHRAHVKTSMMSGVYLTNDVVVERASEEPRVVGSGFEGTGQRAVASPQKEEATSSNDELLDEVERLRRRVQELEKGG